MNVNKHIIKPILATFAVLIALLIAAFLVLHFFFPIVLSNLSYKMGFDKTSLNYMEKAYEKSKSYDQLYSIINLSIKTDNNEKIITYYEKFSESEKYSNFIKNIDDKNMQLDVKSLIKSKLFSEDNYLKNRYVIALTKTEDVMKAFDYSKLNFNQNLSFNSIPVYLFTYLITDNNVGNLPDLTELAQQLVSYFQNSAQVFKDNFNINSDAVKLLVIGNRINEVASNLRTLKNFDQNLVSITSENINEIVRDINTSMAKLV